MRPPKKQKVPSVTPSPKQRSGLCSVHVWSKSVGAFVGAKWCVVARLVSKAWRTHIPSVPTKPGVGPLKMTRVRCGEYKSVFIIENHVDDLWIDCAKDTRVVGSGIRLLLKNAHCSVYIRAHLGNRGNRGNRIKVMFIEKPEAQHAVAWSDSVEWSYEFQ